MSLVAPLVKSLVSPVVVSLLGGGAISAEAALDAALEAESTSGDFVAQPDLTDLTSIFQADGSGNPSIGDSIADATVLDTSQFGGKTAAAFIAGQTELVTNGDFSTDDLTGWTDNSIGTGTASVSSGILSLSRVDVSNRGVLSQAVSPDGESCRLELVKTDSSATLQVKSGNSDPDLATTVFSVSAAGTYSLIVDVSVQVHLLNVSNGTTATVDSISIKHLPGNHTTASGTGPTVLDTFDQTAAALTDNGGRLNSVALADAGNAGGLGDELWIDANVVAQNGATYTGGVATFSASNELVQIEDVSEAGALYEITADLVKTSGSNIRVYAGGLLEVDTTPVTGPVSYTVRAGSNGTIQIRSNGMVGTLSNISVRKVLTAFDGQSNRVTNGTFDADSDWGKGTGWTIGSGVASCDGTQTGNSNLSQAGILTSDQWYLVRFYISAYTAGTVRVLVGGSGNATASFAATGWHEEYVRADGAGLFVQADLNFNGSIDNVSVQEVPYMRDFDIVAGKQYEISFTSASDNVDLIIPDLNINETNLAPGTHKIQGRANVTSTVTGVLLESDGDPTNVWSVTDFTVSEVQSAFDERGPELVETPGGPFTELGGWNPDVFGSPSESISVSNGKIILPRPDSSNFRMITDVVAASDGDTIELIFETGDYGLQVRVGTASLSSQDLGQTFDENGTYTILVKVSSDNPTITIFADTNGEDGELVSFSVKKVIYPNLVDNASWALDSSVTVSGDELTHDGVAGAAATQTNILDGYKWYLVRFYVESVATSVTLRVGDRAVTDETISTTGWKSYYLRSEGGDDDDVRFYSNDAYVIKSTIVQEVPASIARTLYVSTNGTDDKLTLPLPARRNLLTWTEDFDNAAWDKSGISASGTILTASGTTTADFRQDVTRSTNGETVTFSLEVRRISGLGTFQLILEEWDGGFLASSANTSFVLTDEFQRISVTRTGNQAGTYWRCLLRRANGGGASDGEQVEIRKPQLELGSTATDYQRITSDYLADTSITMAVRTSDAQGMLLPFGGSTYYVGRFQDGSTSTTLSANVGSPTIWVDGVVFTGTWDDLHAAIADGDWHVVTFATVDASSASEATPFYVSNANSNNVEGDIAAFSIYPDSTATQALAEAAAADAIKETGYALAA